MTGGGETIGLTLTLKRYGFTFADQELFDL